jgi:hypothetical protein
MNTHVQKLDKILSAEEQFILSAFFDFFQNLSLILCIFLGPFSPLTLFVVLNIFQCAGNAGDLKSSLEFMGQVKVP